MIFLFFFIIIGLLTSFTTLSLSEPSSSTLGSSPTSRAFCDSYPNLKKKKIPNISLPKFDTNTSFARLFEYLEQNSIQYPSSISNNSNCYQWKCVNSDDDTKEKQKSSSRQKKTDSNENNQCIYCTPSIYVGGFSKCGTTALCQKLFSHPEIGQYPFKEVNLFAKFPPNAFISSFERRVINKDIDVRNRFMLDCTSGSYREISSVINLLKYSPSTKVIYIVRDPWQRMGSWLTMAHRSQRKQRFTNVYTNWLSLLKTEIPSTSSRFSSKIIQKLISLFPINGFLYGEILFYWKLAFPNRLLIIDHYDLEHSPRHVMKTIENYLSLTPHNYSSEVLLDTSVNTMISVQNYVNTKDFQFIQNDTEEARSKTRNISPKGMKIRTENNTNIHEPYVFNDVEMLELVGKLFGPSLCLFEKLFHQNIKIVTDEKFIISGDGKK